MDVRPYNESDLLEVVRVFTEAVHQGAAREYDEAQRAAWAPQPPDLEFWRARLAASHTRVAVVGARIAGFIAYEDNGHVDLLFTSPAFTRQGVASVLYEHVESTLYRQGVRELVTEASEVARHFFARQGFELVEREIVTRRNVDMVRYRMRKTLQNAPHARASK